MNIVNIVFFHPHWSDRGIHSKFGGRVHPARVVWVPLEGVCGLACGMDCAAADKQFRSGTSIVKCNHQIRNITPTYKGVDILILSLREPPSRCLLMLSFKYCDFLCHLVPNVIEYLVGQARRAHLTMCQRE